MTRNDLRGYIVFDETPTFIKPFVTFSSVMMGNFTDIDNEGKPRSKKVEEIEKFYDLFVKGTSSEIFNTKYRIGRIKKQVALNLIPDYYDSWSISGKKELSISFYPVDLCPDNTTINTHILIFEGVGDILFKDIRNYKLLDTSEKYNTIVDFQKLEFGITRKNHNDSLFERVMTKIAGLITEPTLIISWKEVNDEKSDSGNSGYRERIRNALLRRNVDCSLFHVTYYGANDNKSTNCFRDYKQIVLLGDWNLPNTESSKIRRAYGMTTDTQDYKDWFFIQLISRIGIRKHIKGESYKVIYTDDFDSWFIERMKRYFNDNLIIRKYSLTNNDWEKKIEEMKIRKNTKTFKNVSDPCIVPKAVESQPRVDCIKSLIGERMSIKMYEQNMAKAKKSSTIQRIAAESRNVWRFFSDVIISISMLLVNLLSNKNNENMLVFPAIMLKKNTDNQTLLNIQI